MKLTYSVLLALMLSFSVMRTEPVHDLRYTTEAYRKEVQRLLLIEANRVARALKLPEDLPIKESDIARIYISPARMAQGARALGHLSTRTFTYYVSVDNKFSFLERNFDDFSRKDYADLRSRYLWPISRLNTNAAYLMATQYLEAASMDVAALNRDCEVHVRALTPGGKSAKQFIPVYWVWWVKKAHESEGSVASIELLEPTRELRLLRVEKPEYIRCRAVTVPNLDKLLE